MNYLSVCSGIEAASVAWEPLGMTPVGFSEIEEYPSAVLRHHWPKVTNFGDMTRFMEWKIDRPIHILVGGTPCQSFSLAGLREGLVDPRGNLALCFVAIAARYRPQWIVWENVPGVFSSWSSQDAPREVQVGDQWECDETSDFGCILAGLQAIGYQLAWRVLDAQYYGLAQRRRRIFIVGHHRSWGAASSVLFDPESLQGRTPPCVEARQKSLSANDAGFGTNRFWRAIAKAFGVGGAMDQKRFPEIANALTADGVGTCGPDDNQAQGGHLIPFAGGSRDGSIAGTLTAKMSKGTGVPAGDECQTLIAFHPTQDPINQHDLCHALGTGSSTHGQATAAIYQQTGSESPYVRKLTPRECERLQGFPDDHTLIEWPGKSRKDTAEMVQYLKAAGYSDTEAAKLALTPDGPRYMAIGNSMAVPVMRSIGQRIQQVEQIASGMGIDWAQ